MGNSLLKSSVGRAAILVAAAAGLALAAPSALADATTSANWAGYAAHRAGVKFKKVIADWRAPSATCIPGVPTYSSIWVGLGGYSVTAPALEQVGTEVDCSPSGKVLSTAWYELVPAASQPVRLAVRPGDLIAASVAISGHRVTVELHDVTTHRWFKKTLRAATVDATSADWIVEAPSECTTAGDCRTLPLANFGTATFGFATAQATSGHFGAISDAGWGATRIVLTPGGRRFVLTAAPTVVLGAAIPSGLTMNGTSFSVRYASVASISSRARGAGRATSTAGAAKLVPLSRLIHASRPARF